MKSFGSRALMNKRITILTQSVHRTEVFSLNYGNSHSRIRQYSPEQIQSNEQSKLTKVNFAILAWKVSLND